MDTGSSEGVDASSLDKLPADKISNDSSSDSGRASIGNDSEEVENTPNTEIENSPSSISDEEDNNKQICLPKEPPRPEDVYVLEKIAFKHEKELSRAEFKELAAKTGFAFGETFSLIERAWSSENRALVRIKLNKTIQDTLINYIVHPCIIDACLQSCIALGSSDSERQVIPIGRYLELMPAAFFFIFFIFLCFTSWLRTLGYREATKNLWI